MANIGESSEIQVLINKLLDDKNKYILFWGYKFHKNENIISLNDGYQININDIRDQDIEKIKSILHIAKKSSGNQRKEKSDIIDNGNSESIKSFNRGAKPTIFNASKSTRFTYQIEPVINNEIINIVNNTASFVEKINILYNNKYRIKFHSVREPVFYYNLLKLNITNIVNDLSTILLDRDILDTKYIRELCDYKSGITDFLYICFLGFSALDGRAKENFTQLITIDQFNAQHNFDLDNKDIINNIKYSLYTFSYLERPDKKKKRCDYGYIYLKNNMCMLDLNLQIRLDNFLHRNK